MTPAQKFVLTIGIILLFSLLVSNLNKQWLDYRLKRQFMQDQKDELQKKLNDKVDELFGFNRKEQ